MFVGVEVSDLTGSHIRQIQVRCGRWQIVGGGSYACHFGEGCFGNDLDSQSLLFDAVELTRGALERALVDVTLAGIGQRLFIADGFPLARHVSEVWQGSRPV